MCVCHRRCSSINIPSDLTAEETCAIATLSIESLGADHLTLEEGGGGGGDFGKKFPASAC